MFQLAFVRHLQFWGDSVPDLPQSRQKENQNTFYPQRPTSKLPHHALILLVLDDNRVLH